MISLDNEWIIPCFFGKNIIKIICTWNWKSKFYTSSFLSVYLCFWFWFVYTILIMVQYNWHGIIADVSYTTKIGNEWFLDAFQIPNHTGENFSSSGDRSFDWEWNPLLQQVCRRIIKPWILHHLFKYGNLEAATSFLVRYPTEKSWAFYHLLRMRKKLGLTVLVEKTNCLEEQRFLIQYT